MNDGNEFKKELLQLHLSTFVPLTIREILASGGVTDLMFAQARSYATDIGAHGDAILFSVKHKTAEMMGKLVEVVAVLSFVPGGITLFDVHFEAEVLRKQWGIPSPEAEIGRAEKRGNDGT